MKINPRAVMVAFCLLVSVVALALSQAGCGKVEADAHVDGTINHEVSINVDNLKEYFGYSCAHKSPGDFCYEPNASDCVTCMVADFLDKVHL